MLKIKSEVIWEERRNEGIKRKKESQKKRYNGDEGMKDKEKYEWRCEKYIMGVMARKNDAQNETK